MSLIKRWRRTPLSGYFRWTYHKGNDSAGPRHAGFAEPDVNDGNGVVEHQKDLLTAREAALFTLKMLDLEPEQRVQP